MANSRINQLNKLLVLEDLVAVFFQQNRISHDEAIRYCKALTTKFNIDWTHVLCADWFAELLLKHLTLHEISKLDTALCNRNARPSWIVNLEKHSSSVSMKAVIWSDSVIKWIVAKHFHFEVLTIEEGYSNISYDSMYRLTQQCTNLKKLYIDHDSLDLTSNDTRFQYMIACCDKLESIELCSDFPLLHDDFVGLKTCELLQSMKLSFMVPASEEEFFAIHLLKNKAHLKLFDLNIMYTDADGNEDYDHENEDYLLHLGMNCPQLEVFSINQLELNSDHIEIFTKGCTKLKKFEVCCDIYDLELRDKLIECFGLYCSLLEELILIDDSGGEVGDVLHFQDSSIESFAIGCPLLHTLHINHILALTAVGMKHLVDNCLQLKDIQLSSSQVFEGVLHELGKCKNLVNLNLSSCEGVTDEGIDALVKGNGKNLKTLVISHIQALTDLSLSSIGVHCPNLTEICLGCPTDQITLVGLIRLVQKCSKLSKFTYFGSHDTALIQQFIETRKASC